MKIINTDSKPFEWTFDGSIYGPLAPGQIIDLPEEAALHAIKRSVVLDSTGDFERFRVEELSAVSQEKLKAIAIYECPFALTNQCDAKPFKNANDLRAHLEGHWELSPEPLVNKPAAQTQQQARK